MKLVFFFFRTFHVTLRATENRSRGVGRNSKIVVYPSPEKQAQSLRETISTIVEGKERGGTGECFVLRQAWPRFKVFTQRVVAPYVPPVSPLFRSSLYIDRCADELVDAFIAVPVTSLFRCGMPRSHDRDWNIELASPPLPRSRSIDAFAIRRHRDYLSMQFHEIIDSGSPGHFIIKILSLNFAIGIRRVQHSTFRDLSSQGNNSKVNFR